MKVEQRSRSYSWSNITSQRRSGSQQGRRGRVACSEQGRGSGRDMVARSEQG
jgi:hypothetical protein